MKSVALSLLAFALLCFGVCPVARSQAPAQARAPDPPLDSIAQRARPCTACHGEQGRATPEGYFPRIAGKPAGYLFNQLTGFRDGRRFFPEMTFLVERQRDDYCAPSQSTSLTSSCPMRARCRRK
jgi:cytochrome c553